MKEANNVRVKMYVEGVVKRVVGVPNNFFDNTLLLQVFSKVVKKTEVDILSI